MNKDSVDQRYYFTNWSIKYAQPHIWYKKRTNIACLGVFVWLFYQFVKKKKSVYIKQFYSSRTYLLNKFKFITAYYVQNCVQSSVNVIRFRNRLEKLNVARSVLFIVKLRIFYSRCSSINSKVIISIINLHKQSINIIVCPISFDS